MGSSETLQWKILLQILQVISKQQNLPIFIGDKQSLVTSPGFRHSFYILISNKTMEFFRLYWNTFHLLLTKNAFLWQQGLDVFSYCLSHCCCRRQEYWYCMRFSDSAISRLCMLFYDFLVLMALFRVKCEKRSLLISAPRVDDREMCKSLSDKTRTFGH